MWKYMYDRRLDTIVVVSPQTEYLSYVHARVHTNTRFPTSVYQEFLMLRPSSSSFSVPLWSMSHSSSLTGSHSLFPAWMSTVARSCTSPSLCLSLCLYEWWPSPALDRKEDRSHLNSATPPLLNQTPQCQYTHTHTHTASHSAFYWLRKATAA